MLTLVVTHNFAQYQRGDQIRDPAEIARIRESENHANVVATDLPEPVPADAAAALPATS